MKKVLFLSIAIFVLATTNAQTDSGAGEKKVDTMLTKSQRYKLQMADKKNTSLQINKTAEVQIKTVEATAPKSMADTTPTPAGLTSDQIFALEMEKLQVEKKKAELEMLKVEKVEQAKIKEDATLRKDELYDRRDERRGDRREQKYDMRVVSANSSNSNGNGSGNDPSRTDNRVNSWHN
jgi:hypothetical protein